MVGDPPEPDAGLLQRLAAHGVLDRLARLDEAGQRRVHAGREMRAAAEQAAVAAHREHDRHRVGAREVLGVAAGALPLVAARADLGRSATPAAEAVGGVPGEQGAGLGECARGLRVEQPLGGHRAEVDRLDSFGERVGLEPGRGGDHRPGLRPAEEYRLVELRGQRRALRDREIGIVAAAGGLQMDASAAQQHQPGRRIRKRLARRIVAALLRATVDRVSGVADELAGFARRRVEERKGHAILLVVEGRSVTGRSAAAPRTGGGPRAGRVRGSRFPTPVPASRYRPRCARRCGHEAGARCCRAPRC